MSNRATGRPWLHFTARRAAQVMCEGVPLPWLLRLRDGWLDDGRSPLSRRVRRSLLEVVRLRGIPQQGPFRVPGHPDARMVPTDSYIANYLFWLGLDSYEAGQPAWWASLVASHDSVLELGANVGLYTIVGGLADRTTRYRAAEANPRSCDALRRNLEVNGLDHVEVVEAAVVGERTMETVALRFPDRDPYGASAGAFVDGAVEQEGTRARSVAVPAIDVRELVDGADLVKLDVEGLELEILHAVLPWLVEATPTVMVEVLDDATDLHGFLAELIAETGYTSVVVRQGRPVGVPASFICRGRLQQALGTRDVTLLPPNRLGRVGLDVSTD